MYAAVCGHKTCQAPALQQSGVASAIPMAFLGATAFIEGDRFTVLAVDKTIFAWAIILSLIFNYPSLEALCLGTSAGDGSHAAGAVAPSD